MTKGVLPGFLAFLSIDLVGPGWIGFGLSLLLAVIHELLGITNLGFLPLFFGSGSLHSAEMPKETQRAHGRAVSQAAAM